MPKWGWIEWFIISQSALQALLFVPGISPVRPAIRISCYLTGMLAWWMVFQRSKATPGASTFPARPWLIFSAVWILISLAHPNLYSLPAGLAQAMLYLSVLSPAFWAGDSLASPRQLTQVMAVLFLCNALSAALGLAQVYSDRFLPPVIPVASGIFEGDSLKIEVMGRKIFRPCGLSDSPGAAAPAGAVAALIGLCFAVRPGSVLRRLVCVGLAFVGVAVIYYTQIRSSLVVLVFCLLTQMVLLGLQGRVATALTMAAGGGVMIAGALVWVARRMGNIVIDRFATLVGSNQVDLFNRNRGGFVWEALTKTIWDYPLGHGMGWWGMVNMMFFNPMKVSTVWVEVMIAAWVVDGGFPLLIGYGGAVVVATWNAYRIALSNKDPDVSFWATVVFAQNISAVALCFSFVTFTSPIGMQFWLLNAALHAADVQTQAAAKRPESSASASAGPRRRMRRPWPPGHPAT